ncbi:MAG: hypothetical protein IJE23_02030, partial [Tyzzerella sp.]|nr:hypothetical protein [Tyzzerella sp.]
MQNKLKRLAAFLCAFALLVTTVLGGSAMMLVKAADPQESKPVTLDGFANLTLRDFVDKNDVVMEAGEYEGNSGGAYSEFHAKGLTSFHKKLLSMKVKFEA